MLGWLQSHDMFDEGLRIGPEETTLQCVLRAACTQLPSLGVYSERLGERVLFYRWNGWLRLRIGDSEAISLDGCDVSRQVLSPQDARFIVTREGGTVVDRSYRVDKAVLELEIDPTPFLEAEDFDIYLFVANVVNDGDRSARIFR